VCALWPFRERNINSYSNQPVRDLSLGILHRNHVSFTEQWPFKPLMAIYGGLRKFSSWAECIISRVNTAVTKTVDRFFAFR
jgi:hypothetical protein